MSQLGLPAFPPFVEIDQNPGPQWGKWLGRFERLMIAMGITDSRRKRALLLHYAGPKVDEIFDTLTDVGEDTDYDKAVDALNKYFNPKSNSLYETYVFRQAKQESNESLDHFVTRLRQLAQKCKFHDIDREILTQVIHELCISKTKTSSPMQRRRFDIATATRNRKIPRIDVSSRQRLLKEALSIQFSQHVEEAKENAPINQMHKKNAL